ncbi:ester cyclase [Leifsonia kafniensis]|uniref:Ester cyclase n=1 Tax=Leifsonia kafniensis TaxID=475957 RepID=A0ABP7KPH5_9MICO
MMRILQEVGDPLGLSQLQPRDVLREAWGATEDGRNLDRLDDFYADDFVRHCGRDWTREEFKVLMQELQSGFPDLKYETATLLQDGDQIAYRWVATGTHLGVYLGALPTNRTVAFSGITISRVDEGRIVEDWASWNEVSLLHELGILPIDRAPGGVR